jgi:hypothetical protein
MKRELGQDPPVSFWQKLRRAMKHKKGRADIELVSSNEEETVEPQQVVQRRILNSKRKFEWTMVHSHYAAMGGFAVDSGDSEIDFMPPGYPRLAIPTRSLRFVAETQPDLIPDISEAQIRDKSNANELAKALVCFQAIWFCVQCVCRLAQGLAVSLLELNTFAHALCALLIYLLWWNKPLDIQEPTALAGPHQDEMAAYLCMHSEYGTSKPALIKPGSPQVRGATVSLYPGGRSRYSGHLSSATMSTAQLERAYNEPKQPIPQASYFRLYLGRTFHGFELGDDITYYRPRSPLKREARLLLEEREDAFKSTQPFSTIPSFFAHVDLAPGEIRCLDLAERACERWQLEINNSFLKFRSALKTSISDWSFDNVDISDWELSIGIALAGLLYGCLHISAWNAPFKPPLQALLWRLSAVTLSASGPVIGLVHSATYAYDDMIFPHSYGDGSVKYYIRECFIWFLGILFLSYFGLYCFARVDLVAECFISLAHLPASALLLPHWSQYAPHIM